MPYGTIKVDNITFTDNSVDKTVSLSGLIQNPTFTGNVTVTGTISGDVIRGGTTISGVTVTGTTANFVSGVFTTQISGATITGTTVATTTGSFVSLTGTTATFTSGIIASGTAALPSLAILSDPNTGIYSPGADQLAISTSGTEKLIVKSDGKVGIGTSSPVSKLHIEGGNVFAANARDSYAAGVYTGQFLSYDTTAYNAGPVAGIAFGFKYNTTGDSVLAGGVQLLKENATDGNYASALRFLTRVNGVDVTEKMRITSGGNVGIGTTVPQNSLSINSTAGGQIGLSLDWTGGGGPYAVAGLTADSSTGEIRHYAYTNFYHTFYANNIEKARIDTSGRLLVGTSSTSGNGCLIQAQRSSDNASAPAMFFTKSRGTQGSPTEVSSGDQLGVIAFSGYDGAAYKDAAYIIAECDGTWTDGGDTTDNPGRLVFSTTADGAASPTARMTIDSSGYVGINATSPSSFNSYLTSISTSASKAAGVFYGNAASNDGQCALQVVKSSATNTSSQVLVEFFIDAFATGSGRIVSNGASSAAFASFSDENLKENIKDLPGQLDSICKLRPVEFDYKDGSGHQIGFIAQEVQEIYPDVVGAGDDNMLTLTGWSKTEARLVKALQEAIARIETLEANNADMLARLTALEAA